MVLLRKAAMVPVLQRHDRGDHLFTMLTLVAGARANLSP